MAARTAVAGRAGRPPGAGVTVTAPQPVRVVPLSVNAIVPPSGAGETVAVYFTLCPTEDGLDEEFIAVVVVDGAFHVQVSPRLLPLKEPPKSTTLPLALW